MSNKSTTNAASNVAVANNTNERGMDLMIKLLDGPSTLNALGSSRFRVKYLVDEGLVHAKATQRNVIGTDDEGNEVFGRGRPAKLYSLTGKGRARAKRRLKNQSAASNNTAPAETETAA